MKKNFKNLIFLGGKGARETISNIGPLRLPFCENKDAYVF